MLLEYCEFDVTHVEFEDLLVDLKLRWEVRVTVACF
jgi:hypothetical protein